MPANDIPFALEFVIFYNWVKQIQSTITFRSKMFTGSTGYIGVSGRIGTLATWFYRIGAAVFCNIAVCLFICTHRKPPFYRVCGGLIFRNDTSMALIGENYSL